MKTPPLEQFEDQDFQNIPGLWHCLVQESLDRLVQGLVLVGSRPQQGHLKVKVKGEVLSRGRVGLDEIDVQPEDGSLMENNVLRPA